MKMLLNKKYIIILCVVVLGVMGFTGCKKNNTDKEVQNIEDEVIVTPETSEDKEGENAIKDGNKVNTKNVSTVMGDVEVPVNPQRIIVNWYLGDVVTLGNIPVAIYGWTHEAMPFYELLKDLPQIEKWDKEEILSYNPDLIITYNPDDFENLSKIAPVVVIPESGMSSVERYEFIGMVTGHEAEAKTAIDEFEHKLEETEKMLTSDEFSNKTFSILQDWGSNSYGIYYETGSRGGTLLYDFLNLKKPKALTELIEKSGEGRGSLSYEVAADYFGDYVIWFLLDENESEFSQTEIWNSIPAVKEGNIIEVPASKLGLFFFSDVPSMSAQIDYFIDKLNDAVSDK